MDDVENSPVLEARSAKRARPDDMEAPQLDGSSNHDQAAVPASKQPAMHTKALRSVLKGAFSFAARVLLLMTRAMCANAQI